MRARVKVDVIGPVYSRVLSALGCAFRQASHLTGEAAGAVRQWSDPDAPERVYHRLSILGRPPKQENAPKQEKAPPVREREDGDFYQCANCGRIYTADQLHEIEDLWQRCDAGEGLPDGECPVEGCGALCYWMAEEPTAEYVAYCNEENAPDPRD